jgi:copper chaperone CopZ
MFRRLFFKLMTLATAGGLVPLEAMTAGASKIVTYRVTGFSCITCATGLDAMLRQHKGITSRASTYPQGIATIAFDPEQITEKAITCGGASSSSKLETTRTIVCILRPRKPPK